MFFYVRFATPTLKLRCTQAVKEVSALLSVKNTMRSSPIKENQHPSRLREQAVTNI